MTPKQLRQRRAAIEGHAGIRPRRRLIPTTPGPTPTSEAADERLRNRRWPGCTATLIGYSSDEGTDGVRLIAHEADHRLFT